MRNKNIKKNGKSLSKKLSIILIIGVSLVFSLATFIIYDINKKEAYKKFNKKNSSAIAYIEGSLTLPIWNIDLYSINEIAKSFTKDDSLNTLIIYDEDNNILFNYDKTSINEKEYHLIPIIFKETNIALIKISFSKKELSSELLNILYTNIALLLIVLLTLTILTLVVFKLLLKNPIKTLVDNAIHLGKGEYNSKINLDVEEFNPLITVLNSMADKISKQLTLLEDNKNNLEKRVIIEINKRKEQEQLLIQKSRLADMGNMISMIAHQWRQPLSAINTITQNIHLAYYVGKLDDIFINEQIKRSNDIAKKMSSTIDDFRNFFKENKEKESFKIKSVIDESINLIKDSLIHENITINTKYSNNNSTITAFKNELSQVLVNLIINAKDAFSNIEIDKKFIDINTIQKENNIEIIIQDNAGGIKEELLSRIFEPYYTTKKENVGTGLGLYMSKIIIEKNMYGSLYVLNVDKGAKFTINIPIK